MSFSKKTEDCRRPAYEHKQMERKRRFTAKSERANMPGVLGKVSWMDGPKGQARQMQQEERQGERRKKEKKKKIN